jgi:phosphatidylglycerophosphatase A
MPSIQIDRGRPASSVIKRPTFAFMRIKLSRWIALGFGSGLAPFSPGTFGTLWAWVSFILIDLALAQLARNPGVLSLIQGTFLEAHTVTNYAWPLILVLGLLLGVWACGRCGRDLGVSDHGAMVWDEVIAFWLVLWIANTPERAGFSTQLALFILFRFFDILKPPPISHYDATLKGGWGVMIDDLIAAFYTLLALALWRAL